MRELIAQCVWFVKSVQQQNRTKAKKILTNLHQKI